MKLNKHISKALIGAGLIAGLSNPGLSEPVISSKLSVDIQQTSSSLTKSEDINKSNNMTVKSKNNLRTSETYFGGKFGFDIKDAETAISGISIEDYLNRQTGSLNRNLEVYTISASEDGSYSRLRNIAKIIFYTKGLFNFGAAHLSENESRSYTQNAAGFSGKVDTEQNSGAFGLIWRIPFQSSDEGVNFSFNADLMYFLKSRENYNLAFADKSLPGDSSFERRREISPLAFQILAALGFQIKDSFIDEAGIEALGDILTKSVKEKSTTERHMPVYENYKDSRMEFDIGIFANILKYIHVGMGIKSENHSSRGSLEIKKDKPTRFYSSIQVNIPL